MDMVQRLLIVVIQVRVISVLNIIFISLNSELLELSYYVLHRSFVYLFIYFCSIIYLFIHLVVFLFVFETHNLF